MTKIYGHQDKYSEALVHHKRALELQKQYLGENDPSLAEAYNMMSRLYFQQENFGEAG